MSFLIRGATQTYNNISSRAQRFAKRHPLLTKTAKIASVVALAGAAAAAYTFAASKAPSTAEIAQCFSAPAPVCRTVTETIPAAPTLFSETPLRWLAERTYLIGAPQDSILSYQQCVEGAKSTCQQGISLVKETLTSGYTISGSLLAGATAVASRCIFGRSKTPAGQGSKAPKAAPVTSESAKKSKKNKGPKFQKKQPEKKPKTQFEPVTIQGRHFKSLNEVIQSIPTSTNRFDIEALLKEQAANRKQTTAPSPVDSPVDSDDEFEIPRGQLVPAQTQAEVEIPKNFYKLTFVKDGLEQSLFVSPKILRGFLDRLQTANPYLSNRLQFQITPPTESSAPLAIEALHDNSNEVDYRELPRFSYNESTGQYTPDENGRFVFDSSTNRFDDIEETY